MGSASDAGVRYGALGAVLAVVLLAALDLTVVAPILPTMINDLGISPVDADRYAWIVLAYLVAYTVTVPLTGRLSDYLGRLPVFAGALAFFLAGSLLAAQADGLATMIAGRTLQGLGGGAMLPVSMALVADVVPERRRASALGLVAAVDTFGWVLGPVWGAGVNALFDSWRAIFWLNLPLGALAGGLLAYARPGRRGRIASARPNVVNALIAALFLVTFSLALSSGNEGALSSGQGTGTLGSQTNPLADYRWYILIVSAAALAGFVLLERRSANPLLPRDLIRSFTFRMANAANLLIGAALIVAMVNAPLVVALLADTDAVPRDTALLLGAFTLAMTAGALGGGRLMLVQGARRVAAAGLLVGVAGFVAMHFWEDDLRMASMAATMAVAGLGLGLVIAPMGETAIRAAGRASYGAASGLVLLARLLGMTVGLAGVTAYALARLDAKIAGLPAVSPLPGESSTDYFARQQRYLEEQIIPLTLEVIRETFLVAALVCCVAVVVVLLIRSSARPVETPESHPSYPVG